MSQERGSQRPHRHPRIRRALVLLGEVALGGLLGAAITVVEDHVVADRFGGSRLP